MYVLLKALSGVRQCATQDNESENKTPAIGRCSEVIIILEDPPKKVIVDTKYGYRVRESSTYKELVVRHVFGP